MDPKQQGRGKRPDMFINILSIVLMAIGLLFFLGAVVGIVRFPDFYTRMHAAGKGDTLSTMLITGAVALQVLHHFDWSHWTSLFVVVKIMAIGVLIMLTGPTSTHALMQAGFDDGIEPVTQKSGIRALDGSSGSGDLSAKEEERGSGHEDQNGSDIS